MDGRAKALLVTLLSTVCGSCGPGLTLQAALTDVEWVCYNTDECAQGGSYDWLQSCYASAQALKNQADSSGCGSLYNTYYSCANSNYTCDGATANFPGCDSQLNSLEACLNAPTAQSACAQYNQKLSACPPGSGTAPPGSPIVSPCSLNLQCQAQCYLNHVSNVCNPGLTELGAVTACASACPP